MFLTIKEIKEVVALSISNRVLIYENEYLSPEEIISLIKRTDINSIPDDLLSLSDNIHPYIDWNKIQKQKLLRLLVRCSKIKNFVDLNRFNYTFKEISYCIKMHPELIHEFGFDLGKLEKNEIVELLKTGREYFIDHIKFDPNIFSATEAFFILKSFEFNPSLMEKLNIFNIPLNPQYLRDIIIHTGKEYIERFDLKILEPIDWINVLRSDKELIIYCDNTVFNRGDIFYLIEFVILFPEYRYMINDLNKEQITTLGWEKLLIKFGEDIVDLCDFSIITEVSWNKILSYKPGLHVYKL